MHENFDWKRLLDDFFDENGYCDVKKNIRPQNGRDTNQSTCPITKG